MAQPEIQQEKTTQDMTSQQKLELVEQILQLLEQIPGEPCVRRERQQYDILGAVIALAFPMSYYRYRFLRLD